MSDKSSASTPATPLGSPLCDPESRRNDDIQPVHKSNTSLRHDLDEVRHVFLQNNDIPERLQTHQGPFHIVDTGFGIGLKFLATWQAFDACRDNEKKSKHHTWLHFTCIERHPLTKEQLTQALILLPELSSFSQKLLGRYPPATPGFHTLTWPENKVTLTLVFDDIKDAIKQLSAPVHAWYLDDFRQYKKEEIPTTEIQGNDISTKNKRTNNTWPDEIFADIRRISRESHQLNSTPTFTTLATDDITQFGMQGAGFHVERRVGFDKKSDIQAGNYIALTGPEINPLTHRLPWSFDMPALKATATILIAGAGLAGCTTARSLAERGYKISLYDPDGIANGASGNIQGGLYVKLAAGDSATHTDFYRQAYLNAVERVADILTEQNKGKSWDDCGVLQISWSEKEAQRQHSFLSRQQPPERLLYPTTLEQNQTASGNALSNDSLYFPKAGWVAPAEFCHALANHPNITIYKAAINSFEAHDDGITARINNADKQQTNIQADGLIIATACQAHELLGDKIHLPTKAIRGQMSYLDPTTLPDAKSVLCARSYLAPALNGRLCLGATYNLNDDSTELRDSDHQTNIDHLEEFGPEWAKAAETVNIIGGRVSFRCTTPDYLPLIGPVVDSKTFVECFKQITRNAKKVPAITMPWMPNVWLNIGHGSRGLASAPLCAEILAAQISGDAPPVSNTVKDALSPSRFLVRGLIRRKLPAALQQLAEKK